MNLTVIITFLYLLYTVLDSEHVIDITVSRKLKFAGLLLSAIPAFITLVSGCVSLYREKGDRKKYVLHSTFIPLLTEELWTDLLFWLKYSLPKFWHTSFCYCNEAFNRRIVKNVDYIIQAYDPAEAAAQPDSEDFPIDIDPSNHDTKMYKIGRLTYILNIQKIFQPAIEIPFVGVMWKEKLMERVEIQYENVHLMSSLLKWWSEHPEQGIWFDVDVNSRICHCLSLLEIATLMGIGYKFRKINQGGQFFIKGVTEDCKLCTEQFLKREVQEQKSKEVKNLNIPEPFNLSEIAMSSMSGLEESKTLNGFTTNKSETRVESQEENPVGSEELLQIMPDFERGEMIEDGGTSSPRLRDLPEYTRICKFQALELRRSVTVARTLETWNQATQNDSLCMECGRPWGNAVALNSWLGRIGSVKALFTTLQEVSQPVGAWTYAHTPYILELTFQGSWDIELMRDADGLESWKERQIIQGADADNVRLLMTFIGGKMVCVSSSAQVRNQRVRFTGKHLKLPFFITMP